MIRISIAFFFGLGAALRPLREIVAGENLGTHWGTLYSAKRELESLFASQFFWPAIRSSYEPGQKLLKAVTNITNETDFSREIEFMDAYTVTEAAKEFDTVVRAELAVSDAYFVTSKKGFDTSVLMSSAETAFPDDLVIKVPEAVRDIREGGKCIAFDLGTAAGFHLLRANETVLRRYFDHVSNGHKRPKNRNIGTYLNLMGQLGVGAPKTLAVLTQIKDLHRNSLVHPEDVLTTEDAISLFGIVRSTITAMLKELPAPSAGGISPVTQAPPL